MRSWLVVACGHFGSSCSHRPNSFTSSPTLIPPFTRLPPCCVLRRFVGAVASLLVYSSRRSACAEAFLPKVLDLAFEQASAARLAHACEFHVMRMPLSSNFMHTPACRCAHITHFVALGRKSLFCQSARRAAKLCTELELTFYISNCSYEQGFN